MTLTANSADLYTAYSLGPLRLPNRFVMAPMTRNRAGTGNVPTAVVARYYEQRASAGLLVTEATQVAPEGVGYPNTLQASTASSRWPAGDASLTRSTGWADESSSSSGT